MSYQETLPSSAEEEKKKKKGQQAMYVEYEIKRHRRISIEYRLACGHLDLLRLRLHLFLLLVFRFLARLGEAPRRTHN